MYEYPDYLAHYGVKGMKWGVRRQITKMGKGYIKRRNKRQKEENKLRNERRKFNQKHKVLSTVNTAINVRNSSELAKYAGVSAVASGARLAKHAKAYKSGMAIAMRVKNNQIELGNVTKGQQFLDAALTAGLAGAYVHNVKKAYKSAKEYSEDVVNPAIESSKSKFKNRNAK